MIKVKGYLVWTLMAICTCFVSPSAFAQGSGANLSQEYILGPGDKLKVTVFGNEDLTGETEVDPGGQITLPLIQQVPAVGKTINQLEEEIRHRLSPDFVKNPSSYPFVASMSVVNAIALAGGYTYRANKDEVMITRASDPSRKAKPADRSDVVLPGDVIEVKERLF